MATKAHNHQCRCGRKFRCEGIRFAYGGAPASLWPCPRRFCPRCSKKENKNWCSWLDTLPETRQRSGIYND